MYINNIYKVVIYFRAVKLLKTRNLENSCLTKRSCPIEFVVSQYSSFHSIRRFTVFVVSQYLSAHHMSDKVKSY